MQAISFILSAIFLVRASQYSQAFLAMPCVLKADLLLENERLRGELAAKEASSRVDAVVMAGVTSALDTQRAWIERLEATLEARDWELKLHKTYVEGLKLEIKLYESRVEMLEQLPKKATALPELTRAALDAVRKWDEFERVVEQRKMISDLQASKVAAEAELTRLRRGEGLVMKDVWAGLVEAYPEVTLCDDTRLCTESLHSHLREYVRDPSEMHESDEEEEEDDE